MKTAFTFLFALLLSTLGLSQQTAQVQIIHNSPSPTVDIWVNGGKFLPDFAFRTATPFVEVPAGVPLEIGVAPAPSNDPSEIIATFPVTLEADENYVVIANGVVGDPNTPFNLEIISSARTTAQDPDLVDLTVFHGSPDAPAVDVFARDIAQLVDELAFAQSSGYISVPEDTYILDITAAGSPDIVASYVADLNGLAGGAGLVFASGYLNPAMGQPAFGLFVVLPDGSIIELPSIELAALQIVHNSPTPTVDIWVNGQKLISDFEYRTATAFFDAPAGVQLEIGVAPAPSSDPSEIIATFPVTLENGQKYIAVANGVVGDPNTPFNIEVINPAQLEAGQPTNFDGVVFHGSPDAPAVDIYAQGVGQLVDNLAFGENTGYLEIPAGNYLLDITAAGSPDIVVSYLAPLSNLGGLAGLVMASGYLAPSDPSDPEFTLLVVFPNGFIAELPKFETAELQIIHNSPSPTVDIWINGEKAIEGFAFRSATPFLDAPAGIPLQIGVAPSPSNDPSEIIASFDVTLEDGETYIAIANGVVGDPNTPFNLEIITEARTEAGNPDEVDLLVFHGSPDAPAVDVLANGGTPPIVDDLAFGENSGYLSVPAGSYDLGITPADDNSNILLTYRADVSSLEGGAGMVFASGFLNDTPGFGLWVALPDGTVFPLPLVSGTNDQALDAEVNIFPNPVSEWLSVSTTLEESSSFLRYNMFDVTGRMVRTFERTGSGTLYQERFEVGDLDNGYYILQVQNDKNEVSSYPVLIQK